MNRTEISELYKAPNNYADKEVTVCGWVRTIRDSKSLGFMEINDGSYFSNLQIVFEADKLDNFAQVAKQNVGASVVIRGTLVLTPQSRQPFEIQALNIDIEGTSSQDYPLQKKRHTLEYLRTITHLRARTNTLSAAFRIRSLASYAIHKFFNENNFIYVHTPLISCSDCEGAGEMFRVTSFDLNDIPKDDKGEIDYTQDFFGKSAYLTVSGQLQGEALAMALGKIYTFGPTFRAERSYTQRHAAEFWMIEPEIAFADLNDDMALAQAMIKYVLSYLLENARPELEFLNQFVDKELISRLTFVSESDFAHVTYTEAVDILMKHNDTFDYKVFWGADLQTEHERFLTEQIFKKPLFVTDYPKEIKAFYMKQNSDGKTVAAMDLLVPGIGEIIGGSQREDNEETLRARIRELGLDESSYEWYVDLRRFGGTRHAGFGLGFERLIMYATGIANIRDVLPFPRTTGSAL